MDIKESKFFTQRDISLLKALGYKNPTVEAYNVKTEEIDLGEGVSVPFKVQIVEEAAE